MVLLVNSGLRVTSPLNVSDLSVQNGKPGVSPVSVVSPSLFASTAMKSWLVKRVRNSSGAHPLKLVAVKVQVP